MCRAEGFETFPNKEADREIKAFYVYCVNKKNGCTWTGEVKDAKRHVDVDCQFVDMPCPSRCGMKLKRQCVESHLAKDCPCHCQYCGFTGRKIDISTKHKKKCSKYPLPCPNGCKLGVVPSAGMAAHRKMCPLELVHCDYYDVGCHDLVTRQELENHYTKRMAEHLNLMKTKLTSTIEELTKSEKKLVSMEKELGKTKKSLHDTRLNCDKITERLSTTECQLERLTSREQPVGENHTQNVAHDNALHNTSMAMRIRHEQDMKLHYIVTFFRKHNSCMLLITFLFLISSVIENRVVYHRLSQIEEQTWLKSLDDISELSASDDNRVTPFTFKLIEMTHPLVNLTFFPFNDEFEILMTMYWDNNSLSVSLSYKISDLEKTSVKIIRKMLTIELLNQLHNDEHYICPMIIHPNIHTPEPKPCNISSDDTVVCEFHFMAIADIAKKREQYLHNHYLYFRVSEKRFDILMWYAYAFFGPGILNTMLEYRTSVIWLAIALLVLHVMSAAEAWYNVDQNLLYIFPLILFILLYINILGDSKFLDSLLDAFDN